MSGHGEGLKSAWSSQQAFCMWVSEVIDLSKTVQMIPIITVMRTVVNVLIMHHNAELLILTYKKGCHKIILPGAKVVSSKKKVGVKGLTICRRLTSMSNLPVS